MFGVFPAIPDRRIVFSYGLTHELDAQQKKIDHLPFSFFSNYGMEILNYGISVWSVTSRGITEGITDDLIPPGPNQ